MTTASDSEHKEENEGHDTAPTMDPQELITSVREMRVEKLESQCTKEADLDHLIRTVQAVLATNKEIWTRCEPHIYNSSGRKWTFQRVRITKIEVRKPNGRFKGDISAYAWTEQYDFGGPNPPPEQLTRIVAFSVSTSGEDLLPDYDLFFENSLLLHENVLAPFLNLLKDHLEMVQVFLGKIETWILESAPMVSFVENHFKLDLSNEFSVANYSHKHLLREFDIPGEYSITFDIGREKDKESLVKFLEYVSCAQTNQ